MKLKYRYVLDTLQNLKIVGTSGPHREVAKILCGDVVEDIIERKAKSLANKYYYDGYLDQEDIDIIESKKKLVLSQNLDNLELSSTDLNYYPDVFASCGKGVMVFDDTSEKISVNKNTIPDFSENATYSVINARGFSMYPVISDNDKVIIKHWQGEQIIDDKIYLFDYKGELFIKRLVKNIDQVIAKSEDKTLEPRPMETSKLTILGRVISLIRTNL